MLKKEKSQINKSEEILTFPMEDKTVLWFSGINKYIVSQYPASEIIQQVWMKKADSEIIKYCCKHLEMDEEQAKSVVADFRNHLQSKFKKNEQAIKKPGIDLKPIYSGKACYSKKYYKINQFVFFAEFETASAEYYIHPKFAHLEISTPEKYTHHFQVCYENGAYSLIVNETLVGTWGEKDSHFMSGKFSMELLQKIYNKEELDWMGVFHAAGISNGKSCAIFLGTQGMGKALCQLF